MFKRVLTFLISSITTDYLTKPSIILIDHNPMMKGFDIFCASQASTAICFSTNHRSQKNTIKRSYFHWFFSFTH